MPAKCDKLGLDVERDAVQRHPARDADADGGDLVLVAAALVRPPHPDADAVLAPLAADVEGRQRPDQPFLERGDIGRTSGVRRLRSSIA